jgi:putative addiction module component (TIGR02574 family)
MTTEAITAAALALPPKERAALAETLLESLEFDWSEVTYAKEWQQEIEDRIDAYQRGEMRAIPWDEAMRSLKDRTK